MVSLTRFSLLLSATCPKCRPFIHDDRETPNTMLRTVSLACTSCAYRHVRRGPVRGNPVPMANDDILVAYTDGITEAANTSGQLWGVNRLK